MTWINPPRGHRATEDTLPSHHGEPGCVWLSDHDGSVWEATWQTDYPDQQGAMLRVVWTRCHPDRARHLLTQFNPEGYQKALHTVMDELSEA